MNREINIDYKVNLNENRKVIKKLKGFKGLRAIQILIYILFAAITIFSFVREILKNGFSVFGLLMEIVVPVLFITLLNLSVYFITKNINIKIQKQLDGDKTILAIINDKGINVNANISESILDWKYIKAYEKIEQMLIFSISNNKYIFLPIIHLPEDKIQLLDDILESNLTEDQRKPIRFLKIGEPKLTKLDDGEIKDEQ